MKKSLHCEEVPGAFWSKFNAMDYARILLQKDDRIEYVRIEDKTMPLNP